MDNSETRNMTNASFDGKGPTQVTVSQARRTFADLVSRAEFAGERIEITRRGRVVAVLTPPRQSAVAA